MIRKFIKRMSDRIEEKKLKRVWDQEIYDKLFGFDELQFFSYFSSRLILKKLGDKSHNADIVIALKVMKDKGWTAQYLVDFNRKNSLQ